MRFAVASENLRTVTRHAGRARRFLVFEAEPDGTVTPTGGFALAGEMTLSAHPDPSPLDGVEVLIAGSAGLGLVRRLARRGVAVAVTNERDPATAVAAFMRGALPPVDPQADAHRHTHRRNAERGGERHCACTAMSE